MEDDGGVRLDPLPGQSLALLSPQAALALENARLHAEVEAAEKRLEALSETLEKQVADRTRKLSALYQVSAAGSQCLDLHALLSESLARTVAAIRCGAGAIYLVNPSDDTGRPGRLRPAVQQGVTPEFLAQLDAAIAGCGVGNQVIADREPLLILDTAADARTAPALSGASRSTLLVTPMQARGHVVGVLTLMRRRGQAFTLEEISLLASIGDEVAVSVENDRLRQLAQKAVVLQERNEIARELHDSVTQSLYALTMLAEAGQAQLEAGGLDAAGHTFRRIAETTRQALKEMRHCIHQLRPPVLEQEGLVAALHQRLAAVEGRSNVRVRVRIDESLHLSPAVEVALFHIAQEALNNTLRHAAASSVAVHLSRAERNVVLEVADDGRGFDPGAVDGGGMGLANMREYAARIGGRLEVISGVGRGTSVRVAVGAETGETI